MSRIIQETLLPGTDAIRKGTVESSIRGRKILVRYKRLDGYTTQRQFQDRNEAHAFSLSCAVARSEALDLAFQKLHQALVPLIEGLPASADSVLTIRRTIQGDQIKVSFKPGKEE